MTWATISLHPETRDRFRELKRSRGTSYDFLIRQYLDRITAMEDPANRVDLRRER